MCGVNGLLFFPRTDELTGRIQGMNTVLAHRGPDGQGAWVAEQHGLGLGHTRLAILELSPTGAQPMHSHRGRFVCTFNGEIYNHQQLRQRLAIEGSDPCWRGDSDTETLLSCFEVWGIETTLQRCVGMFALALWDKLEKRLYLIRDRVGEKPLYYGYIGKYFAFASELKALRTLSEFDATLDRQALGAFMNRGYVPAPSSIYSGIKKLLPGHLICIDAQQPDKLHQKCWWSFKDTALASHAQPFTSVQEALHNLRHQLMESIHLQSLADVPVGAFLSGGLDSSTIVGLLQQQSIQSVKTFTVGFQQKAYDEAQHASKIAQYFDTEHHNLRITPQDAQELIPQLPDWYDEPFADPSQLPTALVCHYARQQVTVAISGDAGDELFGGYDSYLLAPPIWRYLKQLPQSVRNLLAAVLRSAPPVTLDWLAMKTGQRSLQARNLHKLGESLNGASDLRDFFKQLARHWPNPENLVHGYQQQTNYVYHRTLWENLPAQLAMMLSDSQDELPNDILCKVDRAAMGISLETRIPFLDHRIIELAWRMPLAMKIQGRQGKWILRQLLNEILPKELTERPKQGFNVPLADWLQTDLRDWAEDLLNEQTLKYQGYLHVSKVRHEWEQFLAGRIANPQRLWTVLMFQAWLGRWSNSS